MRTLEVHLSDTKIGHPELGWVDRAPRKPGEDDFDAAERDDRRLERALKAKGINARVTEGTIRLEDS